MGVPLGRPAAPLWGFLGFPRTVVCDRYMGMRGQDDNPKKVNLRDNPKDNPRLPATGTPLMGSTWGWKPLYEKGGKAQNTISVR